MYIFVRGFSGAYKIYNRGSIYPMGLMTGIIIIIIIIVMETLFVFLNVQL